MNKPALPIIETVVGEPSSQIESQILNVLNDYNEQWTHHIEQRPNLAIVLREPGGGNVVGGLLATDEYNWLFVKYLAVPAEFRGLGFGTALMKRCEEIARNRGYFGVFFDTIEPRAKGFYERLGFKVFGELEGSENTIPRFFLKKRLI